MDIHAFSIPGNKNQNGFASIVSGFHKNPAEQYECNGKAIDFAYQVWKELYFMMAKKTSGK